ncbi:MAG: c-type cytochrome [Thermoleophilaceae bacterium]|nr:c-type cytochrome [Thermoleophilaceae bacterium]
MRPLGTTKTKGLPRRLAAVLGTASALLGAGCGEEPPDLANGKRLYTGEGRCAQCHVLERAGSAGNLGPNLDEAFGPAIRQGLGQSTVAGVVRQQIENVRRGSAMPADLVTGQDAEDVAAYVAQAAGRPGEDPAYFEEPGGQPDPEGQLGKRVFVESGCGNCHVLADAGSLGNAGPSLNTLGPAARTYRPGRPPEDYIRESIVDPDAYLVKGFRKGVMPRDYGRRLSKPELDALVSYLKAQGG